MVNFLAVIAVLVWLGVLMWLAVWAFESGMDGEAKRAFLLGAVALVLFAAPISFAMSTEDPNANRLCVRGHEEWRQTQHPPMLVGKVMVSGSVSTDKVWICESWEAR